MARRKVVTPPPVTVGITRQGDEVEYPTPSEPRGGGVSKSTIRTAIRQKFPPAILVPQIYPHANDDGNGGAPVLSYNTGVVNGAALVIEGENLGSIVSVDADIDVTKGGNGGSAPIVVLGTITSTSIEIVLGAVSTTIGDVWGITLTDGDGNKYVCPSMVYVWDDNI